MKDIAVLLRARLHKPWQNAGMKLLCGEEKKTQHVGFDIS